MIITADEKRRISQMLLAQPIGIPVFHAVALRLQQMMNDNSYRIEEAIKLVNEDPSLSAEMLKQANTTYYSGKVPITTIKNAIVRLGSQQIVNLAFTASMVDSRSDNQLVNKYMENLCHHSHVVAITSACLAVEFRNDNKASEINPDEVYLAGLLHAVGKLHLLKSMDRLFKAGRLQSEPNFIDEIIREHNTSQGIKVMQHWNIPKIYINSVERHNAFNWKCGTNDYLVAAVRLSCKIHNHVTQGIELTETCEEFEQVKDELTLLNIDDVTTVYDMVQAISG